MDSQQENKKTLSSENIDGIIKKEESIVFDDICIKFKNLGVNIKIEKDDFFKILICSSKIESFNILKEELIGTSSLKNLFEKINEISMDRKILSKTGIIFESSFVENAFSIKIKNAEGVLLSELTVDNVELVERCISCYGYKEKTPLKFFFLDLKNNNSGNIAIFEFNNKTNIEKSNFKNFYKKINESVFLEKTFLPILKNQKITINGNDFGISSTNLKKPASIKLNLLKMINESVRIKDELKLSSKKQKQNKKQRLKPF